ncbi:MAPK-interacting and spindle-stabilizing protein-like isoform X2 [Phoca vitulina]|uniref:MAPK-interacting and spindle-stabilizing protein-like isoform X2 n=1 Tax=Phoca vitulina TaxID=9720 RepID=UPI001395D8BC|nr:MAPK-interacting and spindle-stabilizing protein-like isoform X2 [Phoca vitulina]
MVNVPPARRAPSVFPHGCSCKGRRGTVSRCPASVSLDEDWLPAQVPPGPLLETPEPASTSCPGNSGPALPQDSAKQENRLPAQGPPSSGGTPTGAGRTELPLLPERAGQQSPDSRARPSCAKAGGSHAAGPPALGGGFCLKAEPEPEVLLSSPQPTCFSGFPGRWPVAGGRPLLCPLSAPHPPEPKVRRARGAARGAGGRPPGSRSPRVPCNQEGLLLCRKDTHMAKNKNKTPEAPGALPVGGNAKWGRRFAGP